MIAATRILAGTLILGVAAGCAQSPPSPFTEPLIQVADDANVRVIAPTFELDFAAQGIRMPERLRVQGVDILGVDDPCQGENRIGIGVAPAVQASAGGSAGNSNIAVLARGPAMAKVRVTYEINYTCPSSERMTGATEFTILPSGRIVREDIDVQPSTNVLGLAGSCGCQQETNVLNFRNLYFSSFWAFDPTNVRLVDENGTAIKKDASDQVYKACMMYPQHAIGIAWPQIPGATTRFGNQVAASYSLDLPTIDDHHMLAPTRQSVTSAIQISATPSPQDSDCAAVLGLLADVSLIIGSTRFDFTDHDGIYRDPAIHTAAFDIVAEVAVPAGFAISVDLGGSNHAVIIGQDGAERAAVVQREAGNRFLIAFRDGLAAGERLTIEPRS